MLLLSHTLVSCRAAFDYVTSAVSPLEITAFNAADAQVALGPLAFPLVVVVLQLSTAILANCSGYRCMRHMFVSEHCFQQLQPLLCPLIEYNQLNVAVTWLIAARRRESKTRGFVMPLALAFRPSTTDCGRSHHSAWVVVYTITHYLKHAHSGKEVLFVPVVYGGILGVPRVAHGVLSGTNIWF